MRKYFILILLSSIYSYDNNYDILETIFDPSGWEEVTQKSDSLTVYKKLLDGIDIPVFKATVVTEVDMDGILEAILDADGQDVFLEDSYLKESKLINYTIKDTTFLYQILDLPVISNRHYITKNHTDTVAATHFRLNWVIDTKQSYSLFDDLIQSKRIEYSDPIFIENGLGSWEVKALNYDQTEVSYYVLIDPGGWIPNYLVTWANKSLGPDTVLLMLDEGDRRGIDTIVTTSYLVCIKEDHDPLVYQRINAENFLVLNNEDIQSFVLSHKIKNIENWMPAATGADCTGGVCLNRIYRFEFEHQKDISLEPLIEKLSGYGSVLYVEEEAARNRTLKK